MPLTRIGHAGCAGPISRFPSVPPWSVAGRSLSARVPKCLGKDHRKQRRGASERTSERDWGGGLVGPKKVLSASLCLYLPLGWRARFFFPPFSPRYRIRYAGRCLGAFVIASREGLGLGLGLVFDADMGCDAMPCGGMMRELCAFVRACLGRACACMLACLHACMDAMDCAFLGCLLASRARHVHGHLDGISYVQCPSMYGCMHPCMYATFAAFAFAFWLFFFDFFLPHGEPFLLSQRPVSDLHAYRSPPVTQATPFFHKR
ncbi:hypothetical protein BS50DRAFT_203859 [Corynespora cassiicola Philippines]|uniref:Uncharacterized protein n=1 Tax=Corynespora cassiicola Philippines TaxID=1448308 RepID=A0A2T2N6B3_CORCC|nr:hypothetical protein BS50DRAFT_203859 [Corynespora cassiicola Philippines]